MNESFRILYGGSETLLVVEDEPAVRGLVCNILESYGYRVLQADSGQAALEQCEKHQGSIDLLLTDLIMPGKLNGRQLAETLCAANPNLKVVFCSGYATGFIEDNFQLHEGINFLQKPFAPLTLAKCVRNCLKSPASHLNKNSS